jgi:hypothetical protein
LWNFLENGKDIQQKIAKFTQILRILNNTFKPTLVQIFSRMKVYNELALHNLLYGREIWTLRKNKKWFTLRWNFGRGESRTSWQETKMIQIKLAMTCNKNEQKKDAKNNADL